jgi:hypothetical protein
MIWYPPGGVMSGPMEEERVDHVVQEAIRLRRWVAEVANWVSATEEQVADTLDRVAEHRPAVDAERLRARASEARRCAAVQRGLSTKYGMRGTDDRADDARQGSN